MKLFKLFSKLIFKDLIKPIFRQIHIHQNLMVVFCSEVTSKQANIIVTTVKTQTARILKFIAKIFW